MYLTLLLWLCMIAALVYGANLRITTRQGWWAMGFYVSFLCASWVLLAHTVVSIFLRLLARHTAKTCPPLGGAPDPVAVLMCTRDDWLPDVAEWCITILRRSDRLFICDDSQHLESRAMVDAFQRLHPLQCTAVRRSDLRGFKAGNLNHCLAFLAGRFSYVAILDHDTKMHPDAIACALSHMSADPELAFVQFGLVCERSPGSLFAKEIGLTIDVASWVQGSRTRYGVPLCIGRAVVFRTAAIEACGGFPTILAEDLGITLRLLRNGKRGRYEPALAASEQVPVDYNRFCVRQARWSIGTIHAWLGPSTRLPFRCWFTIDAIDLLLQTSILWYPFLTMAFIVLLIALLHSAPLMPSRIIGGTLITVLAPLLPSLPILVVAKTPREAFRTAVVQMAVYMSMIVSLNIELASMLVSRKASWINSGNRMVTVTASCRQPIRRLFQAHGLPTLICELLALSVLCLAAREHGWFLLPLIAGVCAGISFRLMAWDELGCQAMTLAPFMACCAVVAEVFIGWTSH